MNGSFSLYLDNSATVVSCKVNAEKHAAKLEDKFRVSSMRITAISIGSKSVELSIQTDCIGKIRLKHPGMLRCKHGVLLITIEGDAVDYQLAEGGGLLLPSRRLCLVEGDATFVLGLESGGCRKKAIQYCRQSLHAILKRGERMVRIFFHSATAQD